MNILLIEPFFTGSHESWCEEYRDTSSHDVRLLTLSGHHWKWRMHGAAVTLARRYMEIASTPDMIVVSDMLDLTTFLALTRKQTANIPVVIYFHENQLTYPWSPSDEDPAQKRDLHYGFINYSSAMSADALLFNSAYHLNSFIDSLPKFLGSFPDHNEFGSIKQIADKSRVLPLGLDLKKFDQFKPSGRTDVNRKPLILWNHRWEYDKNPKEFFDVLFQLQDEGVEFEVAILGESFGNSSILFRQARERLGERVIQFGYAECFAEYAELLWRADILPVHSVHDFFGVSVVQAIYCGCQPLLPKRLAYPEHIPLVKHQYYFYNDIDDLLVRMRSQLKKVCKKSNIEKNDLAEYVTQYDWSVLVKQYDASFADLI